MDAITCVLDGVLWGILSVMGIICVTVIVTKVVLCMVRREPRRCTVAPRYRSPVQRIMDRAKKGRYER